MSNQYIKMAGKRTLKKRTHKKQRGGCASCGKSLMSGGCLCNRRKFFAGKKSRRTRGGKWRGGDCGCGAATMLKFRGGGDGFSTGPTSQTFSSDIAIPFNDTLNDPNTPAFIEQGRLLGDYSSPTFANAGSYVGGRKKRRGRKQTKRMKGGDLLLGASAPANMVLNSGTSIGTGSIVNGLNARVNIDGAPYSQPNLKTSVV